MSTDSPSSAFEGPGSPIRREPPPYSSPGLQRFESFENPLAGRGTESFATTDDETTASENSQFGKALYDFTAGGDDEVKKKRPGRDGKRAGLVPVLYVSSS